LDENPGQKCDYLELAKSEGGVFCISQSYVITSDCKKKAPSIEGYFPFHEPTKSKGSVSEEVQFVMSQIDLSSKKESGSKNIKTEVPTYDFQTPLNLSPQRSKSFLKLQYTVATARNKLV
jgi:hypothetical protein